MKYYLHDTSAFDDEKVSELFLHFGYEGVGLFYVILEKIGKQEKPIKSSVLKSQLKVGKKLKKCWEFMEQIGLISSNNGETFNKQLLNFSEKYQIKKEKNAERIRQWRENQQDTKNVTHYESVCNTPKVNRSKVKEKENKENVTLGSSLEDFPQSNISTSELRILNHSDGIDKKMLWHHRKDIYEKKYTSIIISGGNILNEYGGIRVTTKEFSRYLTNWCQETGKDASVWSLLALYCDINEKEYFHIEKEESAKFEALYEKFKKLFKDTIE